MAGKFVVTKTKSGKFMFNLKAGNGEIILTSEEYNAKASAMNGIESVKKNAVDDARYERKADKNGKPFFTLKAGNGEPIGKSETYSSESAMENGMKSVRPTLPAPRWTTRRWSKRELAGKMRDGTGMVPFFLPRHAVAGDAAGGVSQHALK